MQGDDCTIARFAARDGRLDAAMRCTGQGGVESRVTMAGEADPVRSRLALVIEQSGEVPPIDQLEDVDGVGAVRAGGGRRC